MDIEKYAHTMSSAMSVVQPTLPERRTGNAIDLAPCRAFRKSLHRAINMGFENFRIAIALFRSRLTNAHRASVIGRTAIKL